MCFAHHMHLARWWLGGSTASLQPVFLCSVRSRPLRITPPQSKPRRMLGFILSPANVIDISAILPTYTNWILQAISATDCDAIQGCVAMRYRNSTHIRMTCITLLRARK